MNDELYHHGVEGMHWGIRNGPPYPLDSSVSTGKRLKTETKELANNLYKKGVTKEPKITRDVTNAARSAGSKMYGLEHRLKTKESISRKIETDAIEKEISEKESASSIKDIVRYTTISNNNEFVDSYGKFKAYLELRGYSEERCKNYFEMYKEGKVKHKSVQSVFSDPSGYLFEVQFQTTKSQEAKDKKVPIYEERRKPGLDKKRQEELEQIMVDLAEKVPYPKNIEKIKSH